jgi:hypothetical protein
MGYPAGFDVTWKSLDAVQGNEYMTDTELAKSLKAYLSSSYPDIEVQVKPDSENPSRRAIYFVAEKFRSLYPLQRFHYIRHLIPESFYHQHLAETVWFELAPGETAKDTEYPDDDLIESISPDVMRQLKNRSFFDKLDDMMFGEAEIVGSATCGGDFFTSKAVLKECGFRQEDYSDIFHVLMSAGAYCDCEILYNVADQSKLKERYWSERGLTPLRRKNSPPNNGRQTSTNSVERDFAQGAQQVVVLLRHATAMVLRLLRTLDFSHSDLPAGLPAEGGQQAVANEQ